MNSPEERITAKDALSHPWFTLENIGSSLLSDAQANMKKYHDGLNENRFNVGKIKPEFSMITCSPLLGLRNQKLDDSPLLLTKRESKNTSPFQSPIQSPLNSTREAEMKQVQKL
jgi:hypothetical protein